MPLNELSFERLWTNAEDFPTREDNENIVRSDMQYHPDAIKEYINKVIVSAINTLRDDVDDMTEGTVPDGSIVTEKLANLAVTAGKLASNAVTSGKIATGAVSTAKLADLAVNGDKIATGAIVTAKMGDLSVTTEKLKNTAVTETKLADNAVTTAKLADNGITTAKVADGAITTAKLASTANAPSATKLQTARAIGNASFNGTAGITLSQMGAMGERSSMQWNTAQGATLGWYTIGTISNINSAVIDVWSTSYSEGKGQLIINYSYAADGNTKTPSMVYMGSNLSLCIDAFRLTDNATGTYNGVQTLEAHLSNNGNAHQMRFKSLYIDSGFSFVNTPALVTAARRTTAEVSTQEVLNISGKINPEAITSNIVTTNANKTLALSDAGKFALCNNSSAITVTIPNNADVPFPIGTELEILRYYGGDVTIQAGSSVYLYFPDCGSSTGNSVTIGNRYGVVALKKLYTDRWVISGDLG